MIQFGLVCVRVRVCVCVSVWVCDVLCCAAGVMRYSSGVLVRECYELDDSTAHSMDGYVCLVYVSSILCIWNCSVYHAMN